MDGNLSGSSASLRSNLMIRRRLLIRSIVVLCPLLVAAPRAFAQTESAPAPDQADAVVGSASTPAASTSSVAPLRLPAWKDLFTETAKDFKRFPSRETFTWLGIGAVGASLGHTEDVSLTRALVGATSLQQPMEAGG